MLISAFELSSKQFGLPKLHFFRILVYCDLCNYYSAFTPSFFAIGTASLSVLKRTTHWYLSSGGFWTMLWSSSRAALLKFSGASCVNSQLRRFLLTCFSRILEVNMWTLSLFTFCVAVVFEQLAVIEITKNYFLIIKVIVLHSKKTHYYGWRRNLKKLEADYVFHIQG